MRASSTPPRGPDCNGSIAQSAYSAAKGGIASLTLVQAAELGRYGITANALAPAARTRMTEQAFADKMKRPDAGFDVQDPDNIAPAVVWLGSSESRAVTGCVFELEGGRIMIDNGWNDGPVVDKGARWQPAEVGAAVARTARRAHGPQEGVRNMSTPIQHSSCLPERPQPARRAHGARHRRRRHRHRLCHRQAGSGGGRARVRQRHARAPPGRGGGKAARGQPAPGGRQAVRRHARAGRAGAGAHRDRRPWAGSTCW